MPLTLNDIDSYPVPALLAPRIAKEHNYSEKFAELALREAKRMLYLSHLSGESVSPSTLVDYAWHEMILFTRFYQEFCAFIGGFVHHDPTPGIPDGGKTYARTKENYQKHFDQKPNAQLWP